MSMNKKQFIEALSALADVSNPPALIAAMETLLFRGDFDQLEWQDANSALRQYAAVVDQKL